MQIWMGLTMVLLKVSGMGLQKEIPMWKGALKGPWTWKGDLRGKPMLRVDPREMPMLRVDPRETPMSTGEPMSKGLPMVSLMVSLTALPTAARKDLLMGEQAALSRVATKAEQ